MPQTELAPDITGALSWSRKRIDAVDARILLRHVLKCSAVRLAAYPEARLEAPEWAEFQALVERREAGEPVAYLVGEREFFGRSFLVTPAVLIPRPDTELLVELALAHFGDKAHTRVLDLGTGSGALAVSLALELPEADVTAVDRSREALWVAMANAARLKASVSFVLGDWFSSLGEDRYQLIVANPPYVAAADPHLDEGDVRFEPSVALAAGPDGLDDLAAIAAEAPRHLEPGGWLFMEHGYDQAAPVRGLLTDAGFSAIGSWKDLSGIERVSGGRWLGRGRDAGDRGAAPGRDY
ncbi:MAG: peptide chain release factor N(5)-glutamine methyltransferase [Aromatoleum sp.]|jgi:release factor glutamine methyltransferase|uniref:peptide chain release factor N(5)-glutamine methyltransferase n=1 Tax=Aromatoleum sp. TaxID=2307007 RepID=UPI0028961E64|nr:peptide chain release factor N(5)-glutamine methyltransferase [Aromatoleum sp.]MDT3668831.1 peptide chain release factor N(5)-glutamine methyltransferase [Aromatoleum sp.]